MKKQQTKYSEQEKEAFRDKLVSVIIWFTIGFSCGVIFIIQILKK